MSLLLDPAFLYHAAYAVSRLNLPSYAEPFAVGLATVLVDIPYDIVAVKFVHWTWHDTDPNIFDRYVGMYSDKSIEKGIWLPHTTLFSYLPLVFMI